MRQSSEQIAKQYADAKRNKNSFGDAGYNVKTFGAQGDGATSDTAVVQGLIDKANQEGGGVLFFPKGTYLLNITLKKGVRLVGQSRANVTFKPAVTGNVITFDNYVSNGGLIDLVIDGNPSDPTNNGIYAPRGNGASESQLSGFNYCTFERVKVANCGKYGLYFEGGNYFAVKQFNRFIDLEITSNIAGGAYFIGQVQNNYFERCDFRYNKGHGLTLDRYLEGVTWFTTNDNMFNRCSFEGNKNGATLYGVRSNGGINNTYLGCWFEDNGSDDPTAQSAGFYQNINFASNCGNRFRDCRFASHHNDIWFFDGGGNFIESGNTFAWNGSSPSTKYASIRIESPSLNNEIGQQNFSIQAANPIVSAGGYTVARRRRYGTETFDIGVTEITVTIDEISTPRVVVTPSWGTNAYVVGKSKTGFTIKVTSAPSTGTGFVDWILG